MSAHRDIDALELLEWQARRHHWSRLALQAAARNEPLEDEMPRERFHHHPHRANASGAPDGASHIAVEHPHEHQEGAVHIAYTSHKGNRHVTVVPLADYGEQSIAAARQVAERHFSQME